MLKTGALCLAAAVAIVLAACGEGGDPSPPVVEVHARWNDSAARDLTSLIEATGTVFVGEVTAKTSQTESERPHLPTVDAPAGKVTSHGPPGFPISRFAVRVLEPFAGTVESGDMVVIEQPGGEVEDASGATALAVLEGDEPLEPGTIYLFFALLKENGTYSSPPFARFKVCEDGHIMPMSRWAGLGAPEALGGITADAALQEVQRATR